MPPLPPGPLTSTTTTLRPSTVSTRHLVSISASVIGVDPAWSTRQRLMLSTSGPPNRVTDSSTGVSDFFIRKVAIRSLPCVPTSRHPTGRVQFGTPSAGNLSDWMNSSNSAPWRSTALGLLSILKKYQVFSPGFPAGAMAPRMRRFGSSSPGASDTVSVSTGSLGAVYFDTCGAGLHPVNPTSNANAATASRPAASRNVPSIRKRIPGTRGDPARRRAGEEAGVVGYPYGKRPTRQVKAGTVDRDL